MGGYRYFYLGSGLRGCYSDDSGGIVRVASRRELKSLVESECNDCREAYGYGGAKADIAATVAAAWRKYGSPKWSLPYAIGFGRSRDTADRPFGVFIGPATGSEFRRQEKESDHA